MSNSFVLSFDFFSFFFEIEDDLDATEVDVAADAVATDFVCCCCCCCWVGSLMSPVFLKKT